MTDAKEVGLAAPPRPAGAEMPESFADATAWRGRRDRIAALRSALRGRASQAVAAASALDFGPIDLPGPTGEANMLSLHPRGNVLCLGPDAAGLLDQCVQALAAGNSVIAAAPGARSALAPLAGGGFPLLVAEGEASDEALRRLPLHAVAFHGNPERARSIRQALSRRDGPLVRLVTAPIDAAAYVLERSVCVDTTAAGGNASLLAAAG
jgi:RHH-type proline utilization regulon transcriptional repressor/proline dehydrogenase/delta 1-pyrroline-5-carboxylate dehydrogenase